METDVTELLTELNKVSGQIRKAHGQISDLDADRDAMVHAARTAGASWYQVGQALGITKQSAWERYRHQEAAS